MTIRRTISSRSCSCFSNYNPGNITKGWRVISDWKEHEVKEHRRFDQNLASRRVVRELLLGAGIRLRKRLGQNFLVDSNMTEKIARLAELERDDYVLEIGPGLGGLTQALYRQCAKVVAVEVDTRLADILANVLPRDVTVIVGDALELDWEKCLRQAGWRGEPVKLVANLPYYITSPLLMKALEEPPPFAAVVAMVQREVAYRIAAEPGTPDYGVLSLAVRYYGSVSVAAAVPRQLFLPIPEVDSAVIRVDPMSNPNLRAPKELTFAIIRTAFSERRKTIRNALKRFLKRTYRPRLTGDEVEDCVKNMLASAALSGSERPEMLALETFDTLAYSVFLAQQQG